MKNTNKFDFIIVGQGIAGTILAFNLLQMNKTVLMIDQLQENEESSSKIALGIYNPLVLKWITKSWKADEQIKYLFDFIHSFESFFNQKINQKKYIHRILKTNYEINNWKTKQTLNKLKKYMSSDLKVLSISKEFFGVVLNSGWIDVKQMLSIFLNFLKKNELFVNEKFDYKKVNLNSDYIEYENFKCERIVFCEGCSVLNNPFFNDLKLKPTKGETLKIHIPNLKLEEVVHTGVITIPLGDDIYHIGSTFDWEDGTMAPTEKSKVDLINKLPFLKKEAYKVMDHQAAHRPSTFDRRPILGAHKKYNNLFIFNGLGARGLLLSPYLSKELIEFMFQGKVINPEISINRF